MPFAHIATYVRQRLGRDPQMLLALDLDGTLLLKGDVVPPDAAAALQEVAERGVGIVIATGRRYRIALTAVAQLQFPFLLLSHNGALLKDPATHTTIHLESFPDALVEPVWSLLRDKGLGPVGHLDRHDNPPEILTVAPVAGSYHAAMVAARYAGIAGILDGELPSYPLVQMLAFGTPEILYPIQAEVEALAPNGLYCHTMRVPHEEIFVLEILHPEGSKWAGIARLATALGLPIASVVAAGDDANDIPMLRGAGLGVAMGNGTAEAKAAADVVVASNVDGGIAELVERYVLPRLLRH
ncbi:MAG: HAD hydrolase family protein [bacterium]